MGNKIFAKHPFGAILMEFRLNLLKEKLELMSRGLLSNISIFSMFLRVSWILLKIRFWEVLVEFKIILIKLLRILKSFWILKEILL
jgi:hypothetical protein